MNDKEKILTILNKTKPVIRKKFKKDMLWNNFPKDVMIVGEDSINVYSYIDLEYAHIKFGFDRKGNLNDIVLSGNY